MNRAAMQQALEALMMMRDKYEEYACPACDHADAAIPALRAALAESEQAPISLNNGRLTQYPDGRIGFGTRESVGAIGHAPTPRKPQTTHWEGCEAVHPECKAKAITADEMSAWVKDTWEKCQAEAWQEPVAYCTLEQLAALKLTVPSSDKIPLYTAPTPRKPLTDEEIDELSRSMVRGDKSVNWLCRAIERAHGIGEQT